MQGISAIHCLKGDVRHLLTSLHAPHFRYIYFFPSAFLSNFVGHTRKS